MKGGKKSDRLRTLGPRSNTMKVCISGGLVWSGDSLQRQTGIAVALIAIALLSVCPREIKVYVDIKHMHECL